MAIAIYPFRDEHTAAVREFNNRVRGSKGAFEFPETAVPEWLPPSPGRRIFQEGFLALDRGEVHGGYLLKRQDFSFGGSVESVACFHSALSEGIAEVVYSDVKDQLLADALERYPLLYAFDQSQPHVRQESGCKSTPVPFYFRIVHPSAFLRNMETLRTTAWRRFFLSLAAFSGVGSAGVRLYQRMNAASRPTPPTAVDFFDSFGPWADDLWTQCVPSYPFIAVRDSATLAILYPGGKFLRIKVARAGQTIGYAIVLDTQMQWNRQFGDMRLGSIIDCLALPENAPLVIAAARRVLERRGIDLILCDHSHPAWGAALRGAGFLQGPPQFLFGASPLLAAKLEKASASDHLFMMRGDGNARALPEFAHPLI